MAASTFHLFSFLPWELRHQIWELSLRPSGHPRGLHRFVLTSHKLEWEPPNDDSGRKYNMESYEQPVNLLGYQGEKEGIETAKDVIESDTRSQILLDPLFEPSGTSSNTFVMTAVPKIGHRQDDPTGVPHRRSAYLWDAGLWTACWESRKVVAKRFSQFHLGRTGPGPFERGPPDDWPHNMRKITVPQHGQSWSLVLQPRFELICLSCTDWGLDIDWKYELRYLVICRAPLALSQSISWDPEHVAVEFDPSWNLDWPHYFHDLLREPSPRGFVARLVGAQAAGVFCRDKTIWLIDRSTTMHKARARPRKSFYDLDIEYVETSTSELTFFDGEEQIKNSAYFIQKLKWSNDYLESYLDETDGNLSESEPYRFDMNDTLRILLCRQT